ncbi:MAG: hypothetical protein ILM98_01335, partial [Kiritimatiellae bacterium]|nr:hypothetical protein [Kiritimatiellia bacterium]
MTARTRAWARVLAVVVSAFAPLVARAGFTSEATLSSSSVGDNLANGTVYVVSGDATIERPSYSANSALYVNDNATTVIYVKKGSTLTVKGGNASGTESAGAGIRLNNGATLVVTGQGTLNVTGGNAANGEGGYNGTSGYFRSGLDYWTAGSGGKGGYGGGGASAAIGGVGGNGGNGGNGASSSENECHYWSRNEYTGNGSDGGGGSGAG